MRNISRIFTTMNMGHVIGTLFIVFMINGCTTIAPTPAKIPKAIFFIVDGIPADVLEWTDTPHRDEIAGSSGYTRSYVRGEIGGPSETPTVSASGYSSVVGRDPVERSIERRPRKLTGLS